MPTNSRTPSGSGGGSTSNVCSISPSDNVGNVNSLTKRVEELEKAVSKLLGRNVTANQLSDISQNVGWTYNVNYMGQDGWTKTEYGTLIPPTGWSLSSLGLLDYAGNPYQGGVFDSDHAPVFAFTSNGGLVGERVTAWNAAAAGTATLDYACYSRSQASVLVNESRGITMTPTLSSPGGVSVSAEIATDGIYLIFCVNNMGPATSGAPVDNANIKVNGSTVAKAVARNEFDKYGQSSAAAVIMSLSVGDTVVGENDDIANIGHNEFFQFGIIMVSA